MFKAQKDFPNASKMCFTRLSLMILNKEKCQNVKLNYFILKTRFENGNSFENLKNKAEIKTEKAEIKIDEAENRTEIAEIKTENRDEADNFDFSYIINEQKSKYDWINSEKTQEIIDLNTLENTEIESAKKIPKNSYNGILRGYLISCVLHDKVFEVYIQDLIESLGGCYVELDSAMTDFLVCDEEFQNYGESLIIVSPK